MLETIKNETKKLNKLEKTMKSLIILYKKQKVTKFTKEKAI